MTNIEKGHKPAAGVGIDPGAVQEVILGTIPESEPAAKAPPHQFPRCVFPISRWTI